MVQTKVAQNYISYKKLTGSISLSTPGVELWGFKDVTCLKYNNTLEWESRFWAKCYKKILIILKYDSNKGCAKLNF